MDTFRDTTALTYDDLANRLGIDVQSARRRAQRGRWLRTKGNDGRARVHVPVTVLETLTGKNATPIGHVPATDATPPDLVVELRRRAEAAETRAEALVGQVAEQGERAARAEGEVAAVREALAHERLRAEQAEVAREAVAGELNTWTAGGPLARAARAFLWRRG